MKLRKLPLALALCGLPFPTLAGTMQIVNDSGVPDSQVYVMLSGKALSPAAADMSIHAVGLDTSPTGLVCGQQLSTLTQSGTVPSERTGASLPLYQVTINTVNSGRLWVSYYGSGTAPSCAAGNGVVQFNGAAAPLNTEPYRYDKMEVTYDGTTWNANLTALDFLAIPMRMEAVSAAGTIDDSRSFYASIYTLGSAAYQLFGANSLGWNGTTPLRIYGPGTMTTNVNASTGSPAPYPSFAPYLASLVGITNLDTSGSQSFAELTQANGGAPVYVDDNGNTQYLEIPAYSASYDYGIQVQQASNGYNLALTPKSFTVTSGTLPSYLPSGGNVGITIPLTGKVLDRNLYATPLDSSTFQLASPITYPANCQTTACQESFYAAAVGNTVYGWVVANVTSGLVLGFFNRDASANSTADWYSSIPAMQPFGAARTWLDGFYDPYAALIFNASDAYGFPFSDRITVGVNPLLQSTDPNLRVTILADDMPDAPVATAAPGSTSGSLNVSWQAVPCYESGCTVGYTVAVWPPAPSMPQPSVGQTGLDITGLTPGVVYTVKVGAQITAGGVTSQSPVLPVQGVAAGTFSMAAVDPTNGVYGLNLNSNWQVPQGWSLEIAGNPFTAPTPVAVAATVGKNYFPVVLKNAAGNVVYQNSYEVELAAPKAGIVAPAGVHSFFQLTKNPVLGENNFGNSITLSPSGTGYDATDDVTTGTTRGLGAGNPLPWQVMDSSLVIGTPGNPIIGKQRQPVIALDCLFNAVEKLYPTDFPAGPATTWQATWTPSPTQPGVGRQYTNGNAMLISSDNNAWGILGGQAYNVGPAAGWLNQNHCTFPATPSNL